MSLKHLLGGLDGRAGRFTVAATPLELVGQPRLTVVRTVKTVSRRAA